MKSIKREIKLEIKRLKASFSKLDYKIDLSSCLICKKDPGNNFILKYKKNNELKGKLCVSCSRNGLKQ
ncbi:MAG: hypothetical protein AABX19_02510 [Nanoarchaeota archaeon]